MGYIEPGPTTASGYDGWTRTSPRRCANFRTIATVASSSSIAASTISSVINSDSRAATHSANTSADIPANIPTGIPANIASFTSTTFPSLLPDHNTQVYVVFFMVGIGQRTWLLRALSYTDSLRDQHWIVNFGVGEICPMCLLWGVPPPTHGSHSSHDAFGMLQSWCLG